MNYYDDYYYRSSKYDYYDEWYDKPKPKPKTVAKFKPRFVVGERIRNVNTGSEYVLRGYLDNTLLLLEGFEYTSYPEAAYEKIVVSPLDAAKQALDTLRAEGYTVDCTVTREVTTTEKETL